MSDNIDGSGLAFLAAAALFWTIFAIGFYILSSIFLMKIFEKAGVQGKWRAWVPIYNYMVFSKLGDLSPWLILIAIGASILLSWIPVIGWVVGLLPLVVTLLAAWRVGLKLQKEAVWLILYFFLSIVWLGILAFDKSRWNTAIPPAPWAGNGFLADRTVWAGIPSQAPAGGYPVTQSAAGAYPPPAGYEPPTGYAPPPAAAPPASAPTAAPPAAPPAAAPPAAAPTESQPPTTPPAPPTTPPTSPPAPPTTPPA
ncbi:MAG TPA: large exoprotein [Microbacterium sp.]|nr:large exoprotein [Microbacterium sp.]